MKYSIFTVLALNIWTDKPGQQCKPKSACSDQVFRCLPFQHKFYTPHQVLFVLILYVPVNIFSVMLELVFLRRGNIPSCSQWFYFSFRIWQDANVSKYLRLRLHMISRVNNVYSLQRNVFHSQFKGNMSLPYDNLSSFRFKKNPNECLIFFPQNRFVTF